MRHLSLCVALCIVCALCITTVSVHGDSVDANFPMDTLLEHTAIATGQFSPTPRTRLEKLQLTQQHRAPEYLGSNQDQIAYHGADARGSARDGRAKEPQARFAASGARKATGVSRKGKKCTKIGGCGDDRYKGPKPVPPPPAAPVPPPPTVPAWPVPPSPSLPVPMPPKASCQGLCNGDDSDPILARVPAPPLGDLDVATVGLEGEVLSNVLKKIENRSGWLTAQKEWLTKAVEAAATIRHEIELAEFVRAAAASDLEQLKQAQDLLSTRYKANKLKWAYKDNKIKVEDIEEKVHELQHAKADIANRIREAKDEVIVINSTLGPPSQQVQITPAELDDPLKFLEDVEPEEQF